MTIADPLRIAVVRSDLPAVARVKRSPLIQSGPARHEDFGTVDIRA